MDSGNNDWLAQVAISQGPRQRLLGLTNVKVDSAGGGTRGREHTGDDMHVGYFNRVTNAEEIRDLILERLRCFRESGLGNPDEKRAAAATGRRAGVTRHEFPARRRA